MTSRSLVWAGLLGETGLLCAVVRRTGLGPAGQLAGMASASLMDAAVVRQLHGRPARQLGPADVVTLTRGTLCCAVAGLVADSATGGSSAAAVVPASAAALVLDGVDGWVARRTDTVSAFGARLDGEVDAFLILVLSIHAARRFGWWVLPGGVARYAFGVAGWKLPWMRRRLPDRRWHKWVTAIEGIALTAAAASFVPRRVAAAGLGIGLAGVAASFASDLVWLWQRRWREP